MKKKLVKKIWLIISFCVLSLGAFHYNVSFAQDVDGFNIIPELTEQEIKESNDNIRKVWSKWWEVWVKYNDIADKTQKKPAQQLASGIMNRDTIMNYLVYVVQFISQLWLFVWAIFIIYAWYKYMLSVFNWWKTPSSTVTNDIIWVTIVIFSYAIMRILTSLIWLT